MPPHRPGAVLTLDRPSVARASGSMEVRCPLEPGRELRLLLTGAAELVERATPSIEVFLPIAMLIAAMEGQALRVVGPVDRAYLATLRAGLPAIMRLAYGVEALPMELVDPPPGGRGPRLRRSAPASPPLPAPGSVALPFSAGIDSFHSLLQLDRLGLSLRCLVNVNAGAHGLDRRIFDARLARLRAVAGELGVPLLVIDTNLHEVLPYRHDRTYSLRNLPVLGVLGGVVAAAIYSSSLALHQVDLRLTAQSLAYTGPTTAGLVAWSGLPVIAVGHDVDRIQKSREVANAALAARHLDVCVNGGYQRTAGPGEPINCGDCIKCTWTMITFDHLGVLDRFASVFPIDRYRVDRDAWFARLYEPREPGIPESPANREVRELAEAMGARPPRETART